MSATSRGGVPWLRSFRTERILASVMMRLRPPTRPWFARGRQSGLRACDHGSPFHLGQGSHDVEEETSRDRRGVNHIGEANEPYAAVIQSAGEVQEVFHAPAQTIQLPHHQGVTLAQVVQCLVEAGALGLGAADRVLVDIVASGLL